MRACPCVCGLVSSCTCWLLAVECVGPMRSLWRGVASDWYTVADALSTALDDMQVKSRMLMTFVAALWAAQMNMHRRP
jgi:hypothetical protein